LLERFVAVAFQHQGGGTPDINLGITPGKSHELRAAARVCDSMNIHNPQAIMPTPRT
jgi:hypothetical protein